MSLKKIPDASFVGQSKNTLMLLQMCQDAIIIILKSTRTATAPLCIDHLQCYLAQHLQMASLKWQLARWRHGVHYSLAVCCPEPLKLAQQLKNKINNFFILIMKISPRKNSLSGKPEPYKFSGLISTAYATHFEFEISF